MGTDYTVRMLYFACRGGGCAQDRGSIVRGIDAVVDFRGRELVAPPHANGDPPFRSERFHTTLRGWRRGLPRLVPFKGRGSFKRHRASPSRSFCTKS
jgi:hypothetical protein